ncbi:hypothetical protein PCE1_004885 [Barthelona sp. PCE]
MPFITVCGYPRSGKTTVATQIKEFFEERGHNVSLINAESLNVDSFDLTNEFSLNFALRSAAETQMVNGESFCIVDSNNFIKGFRYELFCVARAVSSTFCTVFCDSEYKDEPESFPEDEADRYELSYLVDVCKRVERPRSYHKWDSPLFKSDELSMSVLKKTLFGKKANRLTAVKAVKLSKHMPIDYLSLLTNITFDIIAGIEYQIKNVFDLDLTELEVYNRLDEIVIDDLYDSRRVFVEIMCQTQIEISTDLDEIARLFYEYIANQQWWYPEFE